MPFWVGWATPAKPAWATLMALSAAMLPRWARRLYGWPALPTTDLMATAHGRLLREVASRIPATAENPARAAAFARLSGDGVGSGPTIEDRLLGVQPANS